MRLLSTTRENILGIEESPVDGTVQGKPGLREEAVLEGARALLPHAQFLPLNSPLRPYPSHSVELSLAQLLHVLLGLTVYVDVNVAIHRAVAHPHQILRYTSVFSAGQRVLPEAFHQHIAIHDGIGQCAVHVRRTTPYATPPHALV